MNIDYTQRDRDLYDQELRDFLPSRIVDAHVHLFDTSCLVPGHNFPPTSCYHKFGGQSTLEQLLAWTDVWLPEQTMYINSFGQPSYESDRNQSGVYTGSISDNKRFFGMALVSPKDSIENVRKRVLDNHLIGYKPYLRFVDWKPVADITIEDMLPEDQMQFADERGLAIMLHIPRNDRLSDPVNQKQMVELCHRYPNARIIYAHIGRAYYLKNVVGFLDGIAQCPNAYVDTAMVNHEGVLEYTFRHFPRERTLFGSDAPIACVRGKSVEINNQYAYLIGENYAIGTSIYDADNAVEFTSFFYEQLLGIKLAAERAGLSEDDVENLFFNNANSLFSDVVERNYQK